MFSESSPGHWAVLQLPCCPRGIFQKTYYKTLGISCRPILYIDLHALCSPSGEILLHINPSQPHRCLPASSPLCPSLRHPIIMYRRQLCRSSTLSAIGGGDGEEAIKVTSLLPPWREGRKLKSLLSKGDHEHQHH